MKKAITAAIGVMFLLAAGCGPGKKKAAETAAYPVTIEDVEGIRTVLNPDFPRDGMIHCSLNEELVIGAEEGPQGSVLNQPQSLDVDAAGNIYVMDWGDVELKVFSPGGEFLRTVGRKGQGPGEFESGARFEISGDNKIFILCGRQYRISILDILGEYITGFVVDAFVPKIDIDSRNRVYYSEMLPSEYTLTEDYQKVQSSFALFRRDADGENKVKLGEFKDKVSLRKAKKSGEGAVIGGLISREAYTTCWLVDPLDRIYIGYNEDYKIDVYDPDWKLLFRFGRSYTPIKHPGYKPGQGHPEFYPAFSEWRMSFDDGGNLWLEQYMPEGVEERVYDVFSPEGIYLKQVRVPETINLIRKDKAYSILRTEEEYLVVKRFGMSEAAGQTN